MKKYTALDLRNNQIHTSDFMLDKQRSFSCSLHMSNSLRVFLQKSRYAKSGLDASEFLYDLP